VTFPLPILHHDDRGHWEAAARGELAVPRCRECGLAFWPGGPVCPACLSWAVEWERCSGRGRVTSWVRFHKRYWEGAEVPYVVVLVELEEGPRLISGWASDEEPRVGAPVEVCFRGREGVVLPEFRPA
jgi:uncharacterized OB-fold protein